MTDDTLGGKLRPIPLPLLLVAYGLAAIWLTWPLAWDASGSLPCTGPGCRCDTLYSAWILAWQSHSLVTDPSRIADANIYYPAPDALYFGPSGFGAVPLFLATFLASGSAALATNVMLLLSASLAALSMHWVVRRWTGLDAAGVVAAATVLGQPWYVLGFVGATPHLAPIFYFPLIVWLAANLGRSTLRAAALVVLIALQCLTDPVYVAPAVMAPLATLALWRFVRKRSRTDGTRLAAVLAVAGLCVLPFLLGYLRVRAQNPNLAEQTLWRFVLKPVDLTSLFWRLQNPSTIAPAALLVIVLGTVLAIRRWRGGPLRLPQDQGWRHGALWVGVGALSSLTPTGTFLGHDVYLPGYLLAVSTPLYEILRAPSRLGVAAMIGAGILSGVAFAEVARRLAAANLPARNRRLRIGALVAGFLLLLYFVPSPGNRALTATYPVLAVPRVPASFRAVLAEDRAPLVRLPALIGAHPHPDWNATAMYQSTSHWRPLVNGYSSYWPDGFLERMDVARQLPERSAIARLVGSTGLSAIWVDLAGYSPAERLRWRDAQLGHVRGLELRATEGDQLLFTIDPRAFGTGADAPNVTDEPPAAP